MTHIEHRPIDLSQAIWRKSTFSGDQGDCLEVTDDHPELIPLRDSKRPHGPVLCFGHAAWRPFIDSVKAQQTT
ncbi:DUF397 domain-containing protein [Streptomyces sp. ISL-86]|uniref:DUF397 domain-containing protein n=1 Tax=Streptomyces sp. ISL-86 TaxID=2819187 RepID=UPI001BEAD133|nr:DUF397 domain-containing protein [Streptomyces sp. ISL-86]MBT2456595.1 DUF397 domain-containing protein [Streptomyces sp. ISL-86]